jgi:uncharacterized protein
MPITVVRIKSDFMPRPTCCRQIGDTPAAALFKPAGVPARQLEKVVLQLDEFEAIRLADLEGLYHADAAEQMGVSRQTFGRVLESGRKKLAKAVVHGCAILIEGGVVKMSDMRTFICSNCDASWQLPQGTGCPSACPQCKSASIRRDPRECRHGAGHGPSQGKRHGAGSCCRNRKG